MLKGLMGSYDYTPHEHQWVVGPEVGAYLSTGNNEEYVRCGEVISVSWYGYDSDECTASGCPYGSPGTAYNMTEPTDWSDGDAGGQFGRLDNGVFVPCEAKYVTHYRAPENNPSVIELTVTVDDIPHFDDWSSGAPVSITTADDAPKKSPPKKITAFDILISDGGADFVPTLDGVCPFTTEVKPKVDHLGQSTAGTFTFYLSSSAEPGYCLNATRVSDPPEQDDTVGKDLKFLEPQTDLVTSEFDPDLSLGYTVIPDTEALALVYCLDYGAYGSLGAYFYGPVGISGAAHLPGDRTKTAAPVPKDTNGNNIADAATNWNGGTALEDTDAAPFENRKGDGLSRYEEYRGFSIMGAWKRTEPTKRDLFIYDRDALLDQGNLGGAVPDLDIHKILATELLGRLINFNSQSNHKQNQKGLILQKGNVGNDDYDWGTSNGVGGGVNGSGTIVVDIAKIKATTERDMPPGAQNRLTGILKWAITHELGHGVGIFHHAIATDGDASCALRYPWAEYVPARDNQSVQMWNAISFGVTYCNAMPDECQTYVEIK